MTSIHAVPACWLAGWLASWVPPASRHGVTCLLQRHITILAALHISKSLLCVSKTHCWSKGAISSTVVTKRRAIILQIKESLRLCPSSPNILLSAAVAYLARRRHTHAEGSQTPLQPANTRKRGQLSGILLLLYFLFFDDLDFRRLSPFPSSFESFAISKKRRTWLTDRPLRPSYGLR